MESIGSKNINISHENYNDQITAQPTVKKQVITTKTEFSTESNNTILSNVSNIPLEKNEYELVLHFKNGGDINALTCKQLIALSKLYKFTEEDLIKLKGNTEFLIYLDKNQIVSFINLPEVVKTDITVATTAIELGYYEFIKYIPVGLQTQEMCNHAFVESKSYFNYFSDDFKTFNMCWIYIITVQKINFALIPEKFRCETLYQAFINRIEQYDESAILLNSQLIKGVELLPLVILKENPALITKACISNPKLLSQFDQSLITKDMLEKIAAKSISYIPQEYMDIDLVLIRIANSKSLTTKELAIIDNDFKDYKAEIQNIAVTSINKNPDLYRYLDEDLTEQQCINYCNQNVYLYKKLPAKYKANINIIQHILAKDCTNICMIDSSLLTKEQYQYFFDNIFLPEPRSTATTQEVTSYNDKKHFFIQNIPKEHRSLKMWIYLCTNVSRKYMNEIPDEIFNQEVLTTLIDEYLQNNEFDIGFIEYLFSHKLFNETIRNKILIHSVQCCAKFSCCAIQILKSTKIPNNFKNQLYDDLISGNFYFPPALASELYNKTNPLELNIPVAFITDLLSSCYKYSNPNKLILSKTAQALTDYINNATITKLPLNDTKNIFTNAQVTGGRTIQVDSTNSTTAVFYKIRKQNEDLNDFIKEAHVLNFLNTTFEGNEVKNRLKSDIPVITKMVRMPVVDLPQCALKTEDSIDKYIDDNGTECVDLLVFSANKNYLQYAHKLDTKSEQPFLAPETGLLKACHDLGVFMAEGIYYTNTLPAYHDTGAGRSWCALPMLLGQLPSRKPARNYIYSNITSIFPTGKLENWDTTATERPDYGYTGLRDLGDFEIAGNLTNPLTKSHLELRSFITIQQQILAANTICECLLATVLLYARLHNYSSDYHYKNEDCKQHTAEFLEQVFTIFLTGRTQNKETNLQQFMQLSDSDYNNWLDRAVTEIIYWTAEQPKIIIDNQNITIDPSSELHDCFASNVNDRQLSLSLYDPYIIPSNIQYPTGFVGHFDSQQQYHSTGSNLGKLNGTFPLLALLNFMFLFNSRLNETNL
jgi:hypothetical protein